MKLDIDQIKLNVFKDQAQITVFEPNGKLVESCQTLVPIAADESLYDQFAFLESLKEVFVEMAVGEDYDFPLVEWNEGAQGLFHLNFAKIAGPDGAVVQWTMLDKAPQYEQMLQLQQDRNDNAISEEFATIQKKVAEVERQLVEFQNEELKRIQEFKGEFFAQVSHEMRTPLNSITGLVSLLIEDREKTEEYLPALKATSEHLGAIINDILDISKIDAGKLDFESISFDLKEAAGVIMKGLEYAATDKGVSLNLSLPDESLLVKGDPTRVIQVLYNLLGNSLKFTEKGYVSLSIDLSENDEVLFVVEDTGIGMDPDKIGALLEPYQQAEEKTARLYGGTGLGLHIAVKLIEAMGGELKIKSALNKGTRMSFSLNLTAGSMAAETPQDVLLDLTDYHLLVAEDDALNRKIVEELLKRAGASLTVVTDGLALEKALATGSHDLVITDINIPGKTGMEVFRDNRKSGSVIPFLFISGSELEAMEELKIHESWEFVIKPLTVNEVKQKVKSLLPPKFPTELNLQSLKDMIGSDEAFFKDLVQTILDTLPEEMNRLKQAQMAGDAEICRKVLHKIRPSIDYMGIQELSKERHWLHKYAEEDKLDAAFTRRSTMFDLWVRQVLKKLATEIQ